jgi:predicted phage terminase large subunit-like protein
MLPWTDPRDYEGELLWPARIGKSEISDFKLRLGPSGYAGQFQQRPTPADGARFDRKWFRYYGISQQPTEPPRGSAAPPGGPHDRGRRSAGNAAAEVRPDRSASRETCYHLLAPHGPPRTVLASECDRFAVMDPAGTEPDQNSRPCYTVIQVWDVTDRHEMLLVHQYRAQVQTPDAVDAAIGIVHDFNCEHIAVEKDGIGLGVVQAIKRGGATVKSIKCRGSKEARSETAEIRMAAGMIYFPKDAPFLFDLEQELLHFPKGEYSDQVDALAHAAIEVHKRSGPPTAPPEPPVPDDDLLEYD